MKGAPDLYWEAMVAALGMKDVVLNSAERGKINKALKLIKESGGTPEQITQRAGWYKRIWPRVPFTALALASNWAQIEALARQHNIAPRYSGPAIAPMVASSPSLPAFDREKGMRGIKSVIAAMKGPEKSK